MNQIKTKICVLLTEKVIPNTYFYEVQIVNSQICQLLY